MLRSLSVSKFVPAVTDRLIGKLLVAIALGLAFLSARHYAQGFNQAAIDTGWWLMLACFVAVGVACWWLRHDALPQPQPAVLADNATPISRWERLARTLAAGLGVLCLLIVSEINGQFSGLAALGSVSHNVQFALFCGGIGLLIWGMTESRPPAAQVTAAQRRSAWLELAGLMALTTLALLLRVWQIGDAMRVFVDEVHFVDPTMRFWHDTNVPLLQPFSSIAAFPYLYPYLQALMIEQFGRDLTGLRIISAVFGALTVPALYLLAKHLFDRPTAVIAALLLTTFPPHLQFSRIGLNNIADPLFGVLAMGFLVRGVRTGQRNDFVYGGAALGLTQYFYEGGRLLYPAVIALWLAWLLLTRWRALPRRHVALYLVCAVVVAAPNYYTLIGMGRPLAQRIASASLPTEFWESSLYEPARLTARFSQRLTDTALLLMSRPEGAFYYNGDAPLVSGALAPALILGVGIALWRWRSPGGGLLMLWLCAPLVALALLMLNMATAARLTVLFPALVLLAALAIRQVSVWLLGRTDLLALGIAAVLMFSQGAYYYGTHIDTFLRQHYREQPGQEAIFLAAQMPPYTDVHIIHDAPLHPSAARSMVEFLVDGLFVTTHVPEHVDAAMLRELSRLRNRAFIIRWQDERTKALLVHHYGIDPEDIIPGSNRWTLDNPFVAYFVPGEVMR